MPRLTFPVAVHLFLVKDNKILLLRRFNTGYEDGNYSVIAGHIDGGEDVFTAMIREAKEEAGISIQHDNLHAIQAMHRKKADEERIDYFFKCSKWDGNITIMEPDKCDELIWVEIDNLPCNIVDYVRAAIVNYMGNNQFTIYGWQQTSANDFYLVSPSSGHENQYQEMMDEWEAHQAQYGGWFNPGALRRYSSSQKRTVTYAEWLKWIEDDRKAGQELYFFMSGEKIIGAITIRPKKNAQNIGLDGHCGFGIRPSERKKGYATKMLNMALPIMKNHGINPVVITCDKDNIGSAKVIQNCGGLLVNEITSEKTGNPVQVYHINL